MGTGSPGGGRVPATSPASATSCPRSRMARARCSTWGLLTVPRSSSRTAGQPSLRAMAGNDDVTVVITCFNYGRFLSEAVDSALAQESGPPRVVVVDDGSTEPNTLAALERLPPEVMLVRIPNSGLSAARNAGVARS